MPSEWTLVPDEMQPYWRIMGRECEITLEPRPYYCDRGRWLAKVEAWGLLGLSLDHQDLWPRYYFDFERAKLEIRAWMDVRKQWLGPDEPSPLSMQEKTDAGIRDGSAAAG